MDTPALEAVTDLKAGQAIDAFRLFTGFTPSRESVGAAFDAVIAKRNEPK